MERILDILDNDDDCGVTDVISLKILQNHNSPDKGGVPGTDAPKIQALPELG